MPDAVIGRFMDDLFRITEIEHFQPHGIRISALVEETEILQGIDAVEVYHA